MITETHDIAEARDILDAVRTIDRADTPATTQRRNLANQHRQPQAQVRPRCPIPDWFNQLRNDTAQQLDQARVDYNQNQQDAADLNQQIATAQQQHRLAHRRAQPFNDAVDTAQTTLADALACRRSLNDQLATAKRRDRRALQPALTVADCDSDTATKNRDQAIVAAEPARTVAAQTANRLKELHHEQWHQQLFGQLLADPETINILQDRINTLDTWHQWANGHQLTDTQIQQMTTELFIANDTINEYFTLCSALFTDPPTAAIIRHAEHNLDRTPIPELSID